MSSFDTLPSVSFWSVSRGVVRLALQHLDAARGTILNISCRKDILTCLLVTVVVFGNAVVVFVVGGGGGDDVCICSY